MSSLLFQSRRRLDVLSMGITAEYDDERVMNGLKRIAKAAKAASTPEHKVFVGLGGLEPRPDIIRKLASEFDNIRQVQPTKNAKRSQIHLGRQGFRHAVQLDAVTSFVACKAQRGPPVTPQLIPYHVFSANCVDNPNEASSSWKSTVSGLPVCAPAAMALGSCEKFSCPHSDHSSLFSAENGTKSLAFTTLVVTGAGS